MYIVHEKINRSRPILPWLKVSRGFADKLRVESFIQLGVSPDKAISIVKASADGVQDSRCFYLEGEEESVEGVIVPIPCTSSLLSPVWSV